MLTVIRTSNYWKGIRQHAGKSQQQDRKFWQWLNHVFNRVDPARIKEVGPDRACAEWLLRCGASVKWMNSSRWQSDYNTLPVGDFDKYKIEEIDATDSSVMNVGFRHFKGLNHLRSIKLVRCGYLDDDALSYLPIVKETLREVHLASCGNITDKGLMHFLPLSNLVKLHLFDLQEVKDKEGCVKLLRKSLTGCFVDFPPATDGQA